MASLKMVRCLVHRGAPSKPSLRFVPLEVFGLWTYLMRHRHGFQVIDSETSIWMDVEDGPELSVSSDHLERVDEICLHVFSEKDGMFRRICRYFQVAERDSLTRILLRHYAPHVYEDVQHPQIIERAGVWVRRAR
jgi:hypothetical protein